MIKLMKKKWKEYTIELFLVMLGIVIPFLTYKINDNCRKNKQSKEYTQMLILDLNEDLKILVSNLDSINSDKKCIIQYLTIDSSKIPIQSVELQIKSLVTKIVKYYHFIPMNSTFKDLESTGNISLIKSISAKRSLFQYYRLAELELRMEDSYGQEIEQYLKPAILKSFPIRRLSQYDFWYERSPRFPIKIDEITNNVDFENCLLIKIDHLNNMMLIYQALIEANKSTIKALEQ